MNKKRTLALALILTIGITAEIIAQGGNIHNAGVMTHQSDGTYVVNTTQLAQDVKGFKGATPVRVYIKGDKVVKVEALANQETPGFFAKVKQNLLNKWNGMKASKAAKANVDGATGATFSSKAVKENVKRGVKYYLSHK